VLQTTLPNRRIPLARRGRSARKQRAFTLVELLIALTVAAILAAIAIPSYQNYLTRNQLSQVCDDFTSIDLKAQQFYADNMRYPDALADIGQDQLRDPWNQSYAYLNLTIPANLHQARKDRNLHPISTDFDLYSIGADGQSVKPLTAQPSQDDIIRARNGGYCGFVRDYN
jgi:general secretion pathway protein G